MDLQNLSIQELYKLQNAVDDQIKCIKRKERLNNEKELEKKKEALIEEFRKSHNYDDFVGKYYCLNKAVGLYYAENIVYVRKIVYFVNSQFEVNAELEVVGVECNSYMGYSIRQNIYRIGISRALSMGPRTKEDYQKMITNKILDHILNPEEYDPNATR